MNFRNSRRKSAHKTQRGFCVMFGFAVWTAVRECESTACYDVAKLFYKKPKKV